jgi:hypothetical protein
VRKFIKIFAIWLIAIAIPVQGVASVVMMNCEQPVSHHSQNVAINHHHDQHGEHGMTTEHSHDAVNSIDHGSHGADNSKHACAHCAKCTTCCSGAILIANADNPFQQLNVDEARSSYNTRPFTGFIPSGLERPPRFTLI